MKEARPRPDVGAPAPTRDAHAVVPASESFRALLAPLRAFDAPHVGPATVLDVPRERMPP
jgi:hypothetical protein